MTTPMMTNSALDKQDPLSYLAHMTPEEQAEYNTYLDEQRHRQENTETDWTIRREEPLSAREMSFLSAEEQELYTKWLQNPLSGDEKINFKPVIQRISGLKAWLKRMSLLENVLSEIKLPPEDKLDKLEFDPMPEI